MAVLDVLGKERVILMQTSLCLVNVVAIIMKFLRAAGFSKQRFQTGKTMGGKY
jgi:hypothetical protein